MLYTRWQRPKTISNDNATQPEDAVAGKRCYVEKQLLHISWRSVQIRANKDTETHYEIHVSCSRHCFEKQRVAAGDTWRRTRNMSGAVHTSRECLSGQSHSSFLLKPMVAFSFLDISISKLRERSQSLKKTQGSALKNTASTCWKVAQSRMLWQRRTLTPVNVVMWRWMTIWFGRKNIVRLLAAIMKLSYLTVTCRPHRTLYPLRASGFSRWLHIISKNLRAASCADYEWFFWGAWVERKTCICWSLDWCGSKLQNQSTSTVHSLCAVLNGRHAFHAHNQAAVQKYLESSWGDQDVQVEFTIATWTPSSPLLKRQLISMCFA